MAYRDRSVLLRSVGMTLVLLAVLLPRVSAPESAYADEPVVRDHRDPDARIQVVLKQVHIFDDEDTFGEGEIHLLAIVTECVDARCVWQCAVPNDYCTADGPIFSQALLNFGADSGDRVNLGDRLMPRADDAVFAATRATLGVSDEAGIPVHAGRRYQLGVLGWENDVGPFDFDTLGYLGVDIDESNNWGVGTYTRQSVENEDGKPGDFEITFEIRRTPLPDLVPHHVIPRKLDDGRDIACASALNRGEEPSGPFSMVLTVDGIEPPQGRFTMYGLKPAEVGEHCFLTGPLAAGSHELGLAVDVERAVAEMDEYNNRIGETFALREAPTSGQASLVGAPQNIAPDAAAPSARADLAVKSIRVKGKDPTGQNDCDPGRNDVTVVIRNDGDVAATSFAVRLLVDDDDDGPQRTVSSLDAGKEISVELDRIELKKGQRQLSAAVDPGKAVAESREDNNELEISIRCRTDGDNDDD